MSTSFSRWRMSCQKKQLAALRMWYRGGYTGYFAQQVHRLIVAGYTPEELLEAAVDDTMRKWINDALTQK